MKLTKCKADETIVYMCSNDDLKADYIEPYWMKIKDKTNKNIGEITGYKINIPLITNDILSNTGDSFYELDAISHLCMMLWKYIKNNVQAIKDNPGELYFLNRLELDESNEDIEKEVLTLLKEKYKIVVYSLGSTELFDKFNKMWDEVDYDNYKKMLLATDWVFDEETSFFIHNSPTKDKLEFKEEDYKLENFNTPFESWIKDKGADWINSLWKGIIQQLKFTKHFKQISTLQKENKQEYTELKYLDASKFIKKFTITDFRQSDPSAGYVGEPPEYAKFLRSELIFGTFNRKKYIISFEQDYEVFDEDELTNTISIGAYKGDQEPFDFDVEVWVQGFFEELFDRAYKQYVIENKIGHSIFKAAVNRPTLVIKQH
ncbi:hypothetical protein MZM54_03675 [[Brevibacterium] frigoritolerans]|nr:hypothetical protein [Peribacillus frigoritolerans]